MKINSTEDDYLNRIFWNWEIEFWDEDKISDIKNRNYFSVIIWKNWVGKSSFFEYMIEEFKKNESNSYKDCKMMYITFSLFDNINYQDKNESFIYNWPKNKANAIISSSVYNNKKLKLLNFLDESKLKRKNSILSYIKFLYWENNKWLNLYFEINPKFKANIDEKTIKEIGVTEKDKFDEWIDKLEKIFKKSTLKYDKLKFNKLSTLDIILLYIFSLFYEEISKEENISISSLEKTYEETISKKHVKEILLNFFDRNYHWSEKKNIENYKENVNSLFVFFNLLNWIRDENSMTQAVNLDFYYQINNDSIDTFSIKLTSDISELIKNTKKYKSLKNSSSWELVLLFTLLNLWDYKWYSWKKVILIDEPEISLHPQWQRDYFEKLNTWLELLGIKNCFFIIVTHSPLIVLWWQDLKVKNSNEFERNYNIDTYWFYKEKNNHTTSKKIEYISMNSIDEILWDDFWVDIYSKAYKSNIEKRYKELLKVKKWEQ